MWRKSRRSLVSLLEEAVLLMMRAASHKLREDFLQRAANMLGTGLPAVLARLRQIFRRGFLVGEVRLCSGHYWASGEDYVGSICWLPCSAERSSCEVVLYQTTTT